MAKSLSYSVSIPADLPVSALMTFEGTVKAVGGSFTRADVEAPKRRGRKPGRKPKVNADGTAKRGPGRPPKAKPAEEPIKKAVKPSKVSFVKKEIEPAPVYRKTRPALDDTDE